MWFCHNQRHPKDRNCKIDKEYEEKNYFISVVVFGQTNLIEDRNKEIERIQEIKSISIKFSFNTHALFHFISCRM